MNVHASSHGMAVLFGLGASLVLAGCGGGGLAPGTGSGSGSRIGSSAMALAGIVHSGQQPISGASVSLYVAGTSGYGIGAASPLSGSVTTDSYGKFSIAANFTCPSAAAQTYVIAKRGNAGPGDNPSTILMAALGNCSNLGGNAIADVSEVSSVASVFALAQFMQPGSTAVGTSSTNVTGLVNAFSTVANIIDPATGVARVTPLAGNGKVPQSTINALSNIMAACVNTKGDGACSQLFSLTTPPGGAAPSDTLSAMLDIALNPGNNVTQLSALQPSTRIFKPALAGAPSDWTLSVEYTGGGLNLPQLLAVDGSGNIWVPNAGYPGTLSEFSPTGEPLSGTNGFSGGGLSNPQAVAVDIAGNVWTANQGNGSVSEHTASGTPLSGALGYTGTGLVNPVAIALDAAGNAFTANTQNSTVTKLSPAGTEVAQFVDGGLDNPYAVAVDSSQNVWIVNSGRSNSVSRFSDSGSATTNSGYTGGAMSQPYGIAIDAAGDAWVANFNSSSVSKLNNSGVPLSAAGYPTPSEVSAVAVDGNNTVWTANTDGSISHLSASGVSLSPAAGFISADATGEVGIALDPSGNVWTTDNYINSIFEYIGAAAPTVTPLQLAVKNRTMGQRP